MNSSAQLWIAGASALGAAFAAGAAWKAAAVTRRAAEGALYTRLRDDYASPEFREAVEAVKNGSPDHDQRRMLAHYYWALSDLLHAKAVTGDLAADLRRLSAKYVVKEHIIPWEREHRSQVGTSAVASKETIERFMHEFFPGEES